VFYCRVVDFYCQALEFCIAEHARARQSTPIHTRARQYTPEHANARQSTPVHARARLCTPVYARARQCTPEHVNARQSTIEHASARQITVEHSREQLSTWNCYNIFVHLWKPFFNYRVCKSMSNTPFQVHCINKFIEQIMNKKVLEKRTSKHLNF
jgi:ATP-dependent exoDNAse (exonuclease V) alpha subunit